MSRRPATRRHSKLLEKLSGGAGVEDGGQALAHVPPSNVQAGPSTSRAHPNSLGETSPSARRVESPKRSGGREMRKGTKPRRNGPGKRVASPSPEKVAENPPNPEIVAGEQDANSAQVQRRSPVVSVEKCTAEMNVGQQVAGEKGPRKRTLSTSSERSDGDDSSLTPLTSPASTEPRVKHMFPPTTNIAPRLARQFLRVQAQAQAIDPAAPAVPRSKTNTLSNGESFDSLFAPLDSTDDESHDEKDAGSLVWVCIDPEGRLASCDGKRGDEDTIWWPAKVEYAEPMMRLSLFGDPPGHMGAAGERRLNVSSPSVSNVRSMVLDGRLRFNENNYRPSRPDLSQSSPRKKRRLDLDEAWKEARDIMLKADREGEGMLQEADSTSSRDVGGSVKGKGRASNGSDVEVEKSLFDFDSKSDRPWRAPSVDPLLELPGELVLAKEGKLRTQYWPAKLLEYIKPKRPTQRPKYRVLFFDGTVKPIDKDWFYTTTDDEFSTCTIGDTTGNYGLDPDQDVMEELQGLENFNAPYRPEDERTLRAPSPLPSLPAPRPEAFQYDLEIEEEFQYIKPVLAAVMDRQYEPALQRSDDFMRGGGVRQKVLDHVPLSGSLNARDKEEVAYLIRSWARRRERRQEMGLDVQYPRELLYLQQNGSSKRGRGTKKKQRENDLDLETSLAASGPSLGELESALSEGEVPPPSLVPTEAGSDDDGEMVLQSPPRHELATPEDVVQDSAPMGSNASSAEMETGNAIANGTGHAPPRTVFRDLDALEKITYCNNVLLQEAILQILLWRTGHRTTLGLLSPEEERRLHEVALKESEKSNWVHDVIRLRQAAEKRMLPSAKSRSKGKGKAKSGDAGTRGRPRRGA